MLPYIAIPYVGRTSTYGIILAAYFVAAMGLTVRVAKTSGIEKQAIVAAFGCGVPLGLAGARLLDVAEQWGRYQSLSDVLGRNGSSIYGAFLLVLPAMVAYSRFIGIPALRLMDTGAPAMALGEAASRVGCFLNGCCYGVPWNGAWAVTFPRQSFAYSDEVSRGLLPPDAVHSLPVHPVQLYSVLIMCAVFFLLLRLTLRPHRDGIAIYTFLVAYGTLRLAMAPLRQEALASMKLFSVAFIIVGAVGLLIPWSGSKSADVATCSRLHSAT